MAHDEEITARMRTAIGPQVDLAEKRMMGGMCFMLRGHMLGGTDRPKTGNRRFMFRLGKDNPALAALRGGEPVVMGGRPMAGFYFVEADACDDAMLQAWVAAALHFVEGLPAK